MAAEEQAEREQILAKVTSGVDVKRERQRSTVTAALIAAGLGILFGLYQRNKSSTSSSSAAGKSGLTAAALASKGYNNTWINRILAVEPWVEQYAAAQALDPDLINGIISVESHFSPTAVSSVGASGLMQLMPDTQAGWEAGLKIPSASPFDPRHNIQVGTYGVRRLMNMWNGDIDKMLASYNWGAGNVQKHPGDYPESVDRYIEWVKAAWVKFKSARAAS